MQAALSLSPTSALLERSLPPSPTKRPMLLRAAPLRLRTPLYYRFYRARRAAWQHLYARAPLHFAPELRMNLCPTDEGHTDIAFTGFYEHALSQRLAVHRQEGGLMIDVGANYGYFSLLWAAGLPTNRVLAFEASPRNQVALEKNVAANALASQIEVHRVAAGQTAGTLSFTLGPEEQTGWGGFSNEADAQTVEVPVVALDAVVSEREAVTLLKIDVEGADTWVLKGAAKLLAEKRIKHVYFEQNKTRMTALGIGENEAADFLRGHGYKVRALGNPAAGLVEYYATPAA